jgi:DNA-binding NtrC family response regulator
MSCKAVVRVLLVGEEPREFFLSHKFFERSDCQCHFAKSEREIAELLIATEFDIVLSTHRISGGSIHRLVALLSGLRQVNLAKLSVSY